jgi:hypothetical protein
MKFLAIKFFVEATLPHPCFIIETGGRRSAFSTVQGARGNRRPATRNRPSLSPLPPSGAAIAPAAAAATAATTAPAVAAADAPATLDSSVSAASTSSTPASATLQSESAGADFVSMANMPPLPDTDNMPSQNDVDDYLDEEMESSINGNYEINGHPVGLFSNHSGEGNYEVEEFSVHKRIIHFLGERIDARN